MSDYIIKLAETEDERNGRGYVHYKAWQETYGDLMDSSYLAAMTLEKCTSIAHRFPDNNASQGTILCGVFFIV